MLALKFLKFEYDFSLDNDFHTFENNSIKTILNNKYFISGLTLQRQMVNLVI